jgi:activator of HSP90 ATPase
MSEPIRHEMTLNASPKRIYDALMDSKQHAEFTGGEAKISADAGGEFSTHGGAIVGRNVELVPERRIVQAWRASEWPEGVYSIVRFEMNPEGGATKLTFDHWGAPPEARDHLEAGWKERYWGPLQKFLALD